MEIALIFIVGLCFGSFVTMASYRLPRDQSIIRPRSFCPKCEKTLTSSMLIPLFSWLLSGGKCSACSQKISVRYPLIEVLCGAVFLFMYVQFGLTVEAIILALFGVTLVTLLIADFETKLIPDEIHLFLIPLGLFYHWHMETPWGSLLACCLLAGGVGLLLHYGYYYLRGKHGLGFGDVKFLFVSGVWLADLHQLSVFIFLSGLLGVVTGVLWKFISDDPRFPFGPALALALFILVIWPEAAKPFWELLHQLLS